MPAILEFVAGNTSSKLVVVLKDKGTAYPINLTGATVHLKFSINGGAASNRTMTIQTALDGLVNYTFGTGELIAGDLVGQVFITFPDTTIVFTERFSAVVAAPLS